MVRLALLAYLCPESYFLERAIIDYKQLPYVLRIVHVRTCDIKMMCVQPPLNRYYSCLVFDQINLDIIIILTL